MTQTVIQHGDEAVARYGGPRPGSRLRVGLIAPIAVPVPPTVYGGTELVVDGLARGLVARGCEVSLFASGDSTCPVPLRSVFPHAMGTVADPSVERAHVAAAYRALRDVDVIHDHTSTGPANLQLVAPAPAVVTTVHGAFTPALRAIYERAATRMSVIAISEEQRRRAGRVPISTVIHHGIDGDVFVPGPGDGGYVVFLGRMSATKGPDRAIRIARSAGWPIVVAAKMWEPDEHRYFAQCVEPLLGPDALFIGEVGPAEKVTLLGDAAALVNPICWPEPFGLVMVEALACGTPVVTFPQGAAPEIVRHGRTGFLCTDDEDMIERLRHVEGIDRSVCRADVLARFSNDQMVDRHLDLYRRAVAAPRHVNNVRRLASVGAIGAPASWAAAPAGSRVSA